MTENNDLSARALHLLNTLRTSVLHYKFYFLPAVAKNIIEAYEDLEKIWPQAKARLDHIQEFFFNELAREIPEVKKALEAYEAIEKLFGKAELILADPNTDLETVLSLADDILFCAYRSEQTIHYLDLLLRIQQRTKELIAVEDSGTLQLSAQRVMALIIETLSSHHLDFVSVMNDAVRDLATEEVIPLPVA